MSDDLIERLRAACSREGKPSGAHMIEAQRLIAKSFRTHNEREWHDTADVAETMAACIENEEALFNALQSVALEAAAAMAHLTEDSARWRKLAEELAAAGTECADDLEAELKARYGPYLHHPAERRKYYRDMEPVDKFRKALSHYQEEIGK